MSKAVSARRTKPQPPPPPAENTRRWAGSILLPLAIVLVGGLVYANSLWGAFTLDDDPNITSCLEIRSLLPTRITMLGPPWTSYTGRPAAMFCLALSYRIHGLSTVGFHIGNLAIHLAAALTVFGIIRRTLRLPRLEPCFAGAQDALAAIVAMIWVVHPLTTAAVTYISQRVESQMALFYLLTIYCFIRACTESSVGKQRLAGWLAIVCCLLGLATKEPMVTAPIVALVYDRTLISGSFAAALKQRRWLYIGLGATLVPLAILLSMHPHGSAVGYHFTDFTAVDYLKSQTKSIVMYLKLSFWPSPLIVYYGTAGHDLPILRTFGQYAPWGAVVVTLLAATAWGLWRRRPWAVLAAAFFLILAPSSSIMPMPSEMMADHRMYLPLVAVVSLAVLAIYSWVARIIASASSEQRRMIARIGLVAAGCVVLALGAATYRRNALYQSPLALWKDGLRHRPESPTLLAEVGRLEMNEGNYAEGEHLLTEALARWSNYPTALMAYGQLLERMDRPAEAMREYDIACANAADDITGPYVYLADLLARQGQLTEAIKVLETGVKKNPTQPIAQSQLGGLLMKAGRANEARQHLNEVMRRVPDAAYAYQMNADSLSKRGLLDEAEQELRKARTIAPGDPGISLRLGLIYLSKGRPADAANEFRRGLELAPNEASLLNNLAWIQATTPDPSLRNGTEAVRLALRAVEVSQRKDGSALDTLAAAYAETGRFDLAISTAQEALRLGNQLRNSDANAEDIQKRLKGYGAGKAYRDTGAAGGSTAPSAGG